MKRYLKLSPLVLSLFVLFACSSGDGKSDAFGNFEADEVLVSAEANGKITDLLFDEGDEIKKGQLLCIVDTIPFQLQKNQLIASKQAALVGLEKVRSTIAVQQSQKRIIEKDVDRVTKMIAAAAATQKQFDDATGQLDVITMQIANTKTQLATVNAEVAVINSKIASLSDQINRCKVVAPQNGVVLVKLSELGEMVGVARPILKMAPLNELYLRAYISGDMLHKVSLGQKVEVLIDLDKTNNQLLNGVVSWISSSSEFTPKIIQTKRERVDQVYALKVKVANDGRLKIGMPGELVLPVEKN